METEVYTLIFFRNFLKTKLKHNEPNDLLINNSTRLHIVNLQITIITQCNSTNLTFNYIVPKRNISECMSIVYQKIQCLYSLFQILCRTKKKTIKNEV